VGCLCGFEKNAPAPTTPPPSGAAGAWDDLSMMKGTVLL